LAMLLFLQRHQSYRTRSASERGRERPEQGWSVDMA
jgi:hypothetical protein